jgi:glycosyltransferase involved in cell wall biosynthesis
LTASWGADRARLGAEASIVARILVLNNFDLAVAYADVAAGRAPDHPLYGINHFEQQGHAVEIVPYRRSRALQRASAALRRFPIPLGDLDQQASVIRAARRADLIYCPSQNVAQLLAYLRALRVLDRPIVWVVHHPVDTGRLRRARAPAIRALLRGVDAYPALSALVAGDLSRVAGSGARTEPLSWGPDAGWYPAADGIGRGVIAAGRTNRDLDTFARAVADTAVPAWIVCPERAAPLHNGSSTEIITRDLRYPELVALYAQARAIAIPLHVRWPWPINGLQSLLDALGMGKPVILTRNPWIDIDVERLGIGIWVAPGDVAGWRRAITRLDEEPELAAEMGRRARALVDSGERTSARFARQVMGIFDRVLRDRQRRRDR